VAFSHSQSSRCLAIVEGRKFETCVAPENPLIDLSEQHAPTR
jgi:hypothetical protein